MRVLRDLRLAAAREALQRGAAASVTDLALELQFSNAGRFAGAYRQAYGISPSAALRAEREAS
jgi:AraC-like DNA-binding protein